MNYALHDLGMQESIFSGMLSALQNFCTELMGSSIKSFRLGEKKVTFLPCCQGATFLACLSPGAASDKKIHKSMKVIKDMFEAAHCPEEVRNFGGNTQIFDGFHRKLDLYFQVAGL